MKFEHVVRIKPRLKIFKGYPDQTPYVCVFFILLIFFMMGSSFVPISGIHVDLPLAQTKTIESSKKFIISVNKTGKMYFNDLLLNDMDTLRRHIMELLSRNRRKHERETLIVRADAETDLSIIAQIMSLAEELNLNAVIMAEQPSRQTDNIFIDMEK